MIKSDNERTQLSGSIPELLNDFTHTIESIYSLLSEELDENIADELIARCGKIAIYLAKNPDATAEEIERVFPHISALDN